MFLRSIQAALLKQFHPHQTGPQQRIKENIKNLEDTQKIVFWQVHDLVGNNHRRMSISTPACTLQSAKSKGNFKLEISQKLGEG